MVLLFGTGGEKHDTKKENRFAHNCFRGACIYMWVRAWNQSEQAQANTMIRITDTEGDKIKKIALNIENGELNFEKENGVWYDALDHDIPINQSIMNEIADTVGSISANRKLKKCR